MELKELDIGKLTSEVVYELTRNSEIIATRLGLNAGLSREDAEKVGSTVSGSISDGGGSDSMGDCIQIGIEVLVDQAKEETQ